MASFILDSLLIILFIVGVIAILFQLSNNNRYDVRDAEFKRSIGHNDDENTADIPSKLNYKRLTIKLDEAMRREKNAEAKLAAKVDELAIRESDFAISINDARRRISDLENNRDTIRLKELVRERDDAISRANNAEARLAAAVEELAKKENDFAYKIADAERRAKKAESQLASDVCGNSNQRFASLRRAIAKKFHPDGLQCSAIERAVRTEIFKELWAVIDDVESVTRPSRT
jgi:chromosome segregation ATPase